MMKKWFDNLMGGDLSCISHSCCMSQIVTIDDENMIGIGWLSGYECGESWAFGGGSGGL